MNRFARTLWLVAAVVAFGVMLSVSSSALADGSAYSTAVLNSSPKAYWELGETSGSFADSSGSGLTASASGSGVTRGTTGPAGGSPGVTFTGGSGVISVPYSSTLNPPSDNGYSLEAWVYPTAFNTTHNQTIAGSRGPNWQGGYSLQLGTGGKLGMCAYPAGGSLQCATTTSQITLNQWYYLVGSVKFFTGGGNPHLRLYVNGTKVSDIAMSASTTSPAGSGTPFTIGNFTDSGGNQYPFSGIITQVAFYHGAIEGVNDDQASVIMDHYNAMVGSPPVNTATPVVNGPTLTGESLTTNQGSWGGSPTSYSYQWERCDATGSNCADIPGATDTSYSLTSADVGSTLRSLVTASNASGSASASSDATNTVATGSAYEDAVLSDGPDALWTFDSSGTVANVVTTSHSMTPYNGPTNSPNGPDTNYGSFSHPNQTYYQTDSPIASTDPSGAMTVEAWIKSSDAYGCRTTYGVIAANRGSVNDGWVLDEYSNYGLEFVLGDAGSYIFAISNPEFSGNRWYHVAATFDGSVIRLYVDGKETSYSYASGTATQPATPGTQPITIGTDYLTLSDPADYCYYWDGGIDDVAVYSKALTQTQLDAHYNAIVPQNLTNPTVGGTAQEGKILTGGDPSWLTVPPTLTRQWLRCDSNGANCSDISGATGTTYTLAAADVGQTIKYQVTGSSSAGSTAAISDPTQIVVTGAPVKDSDPQVEVADKVFVGHSLQANLGTWENSPTLTVDWQRCSTSTSCSSTGSSAVPYIITRSDVGFGLRVVVTATNAYGSVQAASAITDPVLDDSSLGQLAVDYRPSLLLNDSERYIPITIDSLLNETLPDGVTPAHMACPDSTTAPNSPCSPTSSVSDLIANTGAGAHLAIWPYHADNADYDCPNDTIIYDCSSDTSAIYYDFGENADGYRFLDYWFFYRYNPVSGDNHEGDWEGVTVELNPTDPGTTPTVAGVVYSAHGDMTFRLASSLSWCPTEPQQGYVDINADQCGQNVSSTHAADFVASGSHASYDYSCASNCYNPALELNVENSHQGFNGWTDNSDTQCNNSCVIPMTAEDTNEPSSGTWTSSYSEWVSSWALWTGKWGGSTGANSFAGESPASPALQTPFECTAEGWVTGCDGFVGNTLGGSSDPMPLGPVGASRHRQLLLGACGTWYDSGLGALACSPTKLRHATATAKLGRSTHSFTARVHGRLSGSSLGLIQVTGGPLSAGQKVVLHGRPARDEIIVINVMRGKRIYALKLTHLHPRHRTISIKITRRLKAPLKIIGARATVKQIPLRFKRHKTRKH